MVRGRWSLVPPKREHSGRNESKLVCLLYLEESNTVAPGILRKLTRNDSADNQLTDYIPFQTRDAFLVCILTSAGRYN